MDPNANLRAQEDLVNLVSLRPSTRRERRELFELQEALRDWLASGGAAPDWAACPNATRGMKARGAIWKKG